MYNPQKLIKTIRTNQEGATINENGTIATNLSGFVVSITDNALSMNDLSDDDKLIAVLDKLHTFKRMLPISENVFYGVWSDGYTVYIDLSFNIASMAEAVLIGRFFNQKAIYDLNSHKSLIL